MAGRFPSSTMEHRKIVEEWMSDCARNAGTQRYDELHIDRIDSAWRESTTWISASLKVLRLATSIGNSAPYRELSVVLAISLQSAQRETGIDFASVGELERKLSRTPPSLYMFPRGKEPWMQPSTESVSIRKTNVDIFDPFLRPKECFYMEFKEEGENDYYRSLFLTG